MENQKSNIIDFIEYRESKFGFDVNLYMNMDYFSFKERYDKIALEADILFDELSEFDRKISILKRKEHLSKEDEKEYSDCVDLGSIKFEEYTYIENKIIILNEIIKQNQWNEINKYIP